MRAQSRHDPHPPPRTSLHWSESLTLRLVLFAILALVTAAQWWQQSQSASRLRADTLEQAQLRATQLASASSSVMSILFRTVDAKALELAEAYLESQGKAFDDRVGRAIHRLPKDAVLQVAVIDPQGYLVYSNLGSGEKVYLGDREHFKVHLQAPSDALFISKPVMGRVSRQWSIQFSRPIRRGGTFVGVLVMSVSPVYLQDALAGITLGSGDTIAVFRQSGEYLARNLDLEGVLGKVADMGRPFVGEAVAATGGFMAASQIDGLQRLYRWQRLDAFPVTLVLGLSAESVLEPAERVIAEDRLKTLVGTSVLWVAAVAIAYLARRIHSQRRRGRQLEFEASYDALTGIHNRLALMRHLAQAIERGQQEGSRFGILYLDLDGFKPVNDQHGHAAGDQALQAVAARIKACVRTTDLAARIGGDEFVVVLASLDDEQALDALQGRIDRALAMPVAVNGVQVHMSASIGRAIFPDDGASADQLLIHADRDMYAHKALGK